MPGHAQSECLRCGQCCSRSSPTLHPEDAELFVRGIFTLADVYTLRKGEFIYDNFSGKLDRLHHELVKVRERPETRICRFLQADASVCSVYEGRPVQCRTLECWNPEPLVELYSSDKLDRLALVQDAQVRELLLHHEERTSFVRLGEYFQALASGGPEGPILDILNFDLHVRNFVVERSVLEPESLPFYFGRPMVECLSGFGYAVSGSEDEGYALVEVSRDRT